MPEAYPLSWPYAWPRHKGVRTRARFSSTGIGKSGYRHATDLQLTDALDRLESEVSKLRASDTLISSNLQLRLDGKPRINQAAPGDPGVAVYFKLNGQERVLACDRWDRVEGNIAAIAAHIGALRGQERWGVGSIEQAFRGYTALPAPGQDRGGGWRKTLGLDGLGDFPLAQIESRYKQLAKLHYNDHDRMVALNIAIEQARAYFNAA